MFTGKAKRGATLFELLIASTLMLLMLGGIYQMLAASKRYMDNAEGKSRVQSEVLKAVALICREVGESDRYAIACDPDHHRMAFPTPRNRFGKIEYDSAGRMLWQAQICYWLDTRNGVRCMLRKVEPLPGGDSPEVPPPPPPESIINKASIRETIVARNIVSFKPKLSIDGTLEFSMKGHLQFLIHSYGVEVSDKVVPNN